MPAAGCSRAQSHSALREDQHGDTPRLAYQLLKISGAWGGKLRSRTRARDSRFNPPPPRLAQKGAPLHYQALTALQQRIMMIMGNALCKAINELACCAARQAQELRYLVRIH
jgi:hypothetical protein